MPKLVGESEEFGDERVPVLDATLHMGRKQAKGKDGNERAAGWLNALEVLGEESSQGPER
jgi:hypothetical protein